VRLGVKRLPPPDERSVRISVRPWSKAPPLKLSATSTVDDALARIITACRVHWSSNLAAARDGRNPEGVHQVRVALRRLRSALSIFKRFIPEKQRAAINLEAKWLLGELGPARDLDVFIATLADSLATDIAGDRSIAELMRAARAARERAQAAAVKALSSARAGRLAARIDAWVSGRGWNGHGGGEHEDARKQTLAAFARRNLNRRLHRLHAAFGDVESLAVPELHRLRIAAKKARYGVEFVAAGLQEKRAVRLAAALKDMQDALGHLNDLDVAKLVVRELLRGSRGDQRRQIAAGGRIVSRWHQKAVNRAKPKAARLWRKIRKIPEF
jgi:CHAD domain-containing protein